jgi:hypothetical protein
MPAMFLERERERTGLERNWSGDGSCTALNRPEPA